MEIKTTKKKNTFSLLCYLKKTNSLRNGQAPNYIRITMNGQVVNISLQGSIDPSLWDRVVRGKVPIDCYSS